MLPRPAWNPEMEKQILSFVITERFIVKLTVTMN